jgi:hypothetical protein
MSTHPYPLWSSTPEPTLVASRDLESGEWVFPYVDFPGPVRIFGRLQGQPAIGDRYVARPDETLGYVFEAAQA